MTKRYTIERVPPADRHHHRFIGHNAAGQFGWVASFINANHYDSKGDAKSFVRQRMHGIPGARVIEHTVH